MSTRPSARSLGDTRTVSDLLEELATLNVSHSTISAQLNTLSKEVYELRSANKILTEENEGWEYLLRERTLNGKMKAGGLLGWHADDGSKEPLHSGAEETELDALHSELNAQSPISEDEHDLAKNPDRGGMLSQSPESGTLKPPMLGRTVSKGESLGDSPIKGAGLDLATELGRAEVDLIASQMNVLGKGDEGEGELIDPIVLLRLTTALHSEVKNLREENKALTLYCSKVSQVSKR